MFLSVHLLEAHTVNPQEFMRCFVYPCTLNKAHKRRLQVLGRCAASEQASHANLPFLKLG